jgi:hypothetical protein
MLTDPKVMEAWFTLMAEAMKGTKEAQQAFQSLSKATLDPADLNRWMGTFMPGLASSAAPQQAEGPEQWLEDWWRMMGVVPRARYLELLEKYDTLTRRLEQARETIEKMRAALDDKAREPGPRAMNSETKRQKKPATIKAESRHNYYLRR